jgi:hypothetical protein
MPFFKIPYSTVMVYSMFPHFAYVDRFSFTYFFFLSFSLLFGGLGDGEGAAKLRLNGAV